ncbi:hypothetical protein ABIB25_000281 [Nakamurella sp. UYEF19]
MRLFKRSVERVQSSAELPVLTVARSSPVVRTRMADVVSTAVVSAGADVTVTDVSVGTGSSGADGARVDGGVPAGCSDEGWVGTTADGPDMRVDLEVIGCPEGCDDADPEG